MEETFAKKLPARKLPDMAVCRAEHTETSFHLAYCLVDNPAGCQYAEPFKIKNFCFHPSREEIIARTRPDRV